MSTLFLEILQELEVHMAIEEEIFYPMVRETTDDISETVDEGVQEHHVAKLLLAEIKQLPDGSDEFIAKITVLIENVEHHVEEEESDLFPPLRNRIDKDRWEQMAERLEARKASSAHPCSPTRSTSPRKSCSTSPATSRSPVARTCRRKSSPPRSPRASHLVRSLDTEGARRQQAAGAQLLEVLPAESFRKEHLPGAVNIPMPELTEERAHAELHADRAVVVYCYDTQCDLSARAAARLEQAGFTEVYDYTGSKAAWLAMDLPYEGSVAVETRAGHLARRAVTCTADTKLGDLPEAGPGGVVLVVDDDGRVLGSIRPDPTDGDGLAIDVAHPAPSSVRPSI